MCPFIDVLGRVIPTYGLFITLGVILSNLIAHRILVPSDYNDLLALEGIAGIGAIIGGKTLFMAITHPWTDTTFIRIDMQTLDLLMQSGFVFYGGLLGALICGYAYCNLKGIFKETQIVQKTLFLVPLAHAFGRLGCFMAGCCYGIEYSGPLCVTFPEQSFAPSDAPLFPVQILEAICLVSLSLYLYSRRKQLAQVLIAEYIGFYAIMRFFIEFLRGDDVERGIFNGLSTSQIISAVLVILVLVYLVYKKQIGEKNDR